MSSEISASTCSSSTTAVPPLPLLAPASLLVGGDWVAGNDVAGVVNPATGTLLTEVASASPEQAVDAVVAAASVQRAWAQSPPRFRSDVLLRAYALVLERREELSLVVTLESGRTLADARSDIAHAARSLRWYAGEAVRIGGSLQGAHGGAHRTVTVQQPVGVAFVVTPWGSPAATVTRKVAAALAAGCAVVLMPAAHASLAALAVSALLTEAGLPGGVLNVLPTSRPSDVAQAALSSGGVRKVSFTGSVEEGRSLKASAAARGMSCSLELSGCSPFIVCADADLDSAVDGAAVAVLRDGGPAPSPPHVFLVHESVVGDFSRRLAAVMGSRLCGPGWLLTTDVGPLTSEAAQLAVELQVSEAVDHGARIVMGGHRADGDGFFFPPTVLGDVPPGAGIVRTGVSGPVAPIVTITDDDDVVALGGGGAEVGSSARVYSRDWSHAVSLAERLDVRAVGVNQGCASEPFEGHELDQFLTPKHIAGCW